MSQQQVQNYIMKNCYDFFILSLSSIVLSNYLFDERVLDNIMWISSEEFKSSILKKQRIDNNKYPFQSHGPVLYGVRIEIEWERDREESHSTSMTDLFAILFRLALEIVRLNEMFPSYVHKHIIPKIHSIN